MKDVTVRGWEDGRRTTFTDKLAAKKPRSITQQSNLRVGDYHYFRSYTRNYPGRIHVQTGKLEYLELPLQVQRKEGSAEKILWPAKDRNDIAGSVGTHFLAASSSAARFSLRPLYLLLVRASLRV